MRTITKIWLFMVILIILTPVGLVLPEYLKAGAAWGEWGPDEIKRLVGYIPLGIAKLSSLWNSPMPDYAFRNSGSKTLSGMSMEYIMSAIVGVLIISAVMFLIGRFLQRRNGVDSEK